MSINYFSKNSSQPASYDNVINLINSPLNTSCRRTSEFRLCIQKRKSTFKNLVISPPRIGGIERCVNQYLSRYQAEVLLGKETHNFFFA
jgi:hypothetical protein